MEFFAVLVGGPFDGLQQKTSAKATDDLLYEVGKTAAGVQKFASYAFNGREGRAVLPDGLVPCREYTFSGHVMGSELKIINGLEEAP